jgi:hypothetical protein
MYELRRFYEKNAKGWFYQKKKPLLPAPKSKTGMDALKALFKYVSTFGFATEGYNPAPSKKAKKTTPKMAVGGTTTKRIIKKSTGGMYGIPQENLGTSGQYGFAKKGGAVKKMKTGGTAKPLIKAKNGKIVKTITPFQNYMKTPGAIASDTSDVFTGNRDGLNPKLDKAYYDTYYAGRKNERRTGNDKVKYDANGKRVYKKGGATKAAKFAALAPPYDKATFADKIAGAKKNASSKKLPKAQFGAFIKAFSKVVKPIAKVVKPVSKISKPVAKRIATTSKKNIPKKIDFRNTKNSMERMMESKQIQNYFKRSTQRDKLLNLVNKNKN